MNLYKVIINGVCDMIGYHDIYTVAAENFSIAIEKSKNKMLLNKHVSKIEVESIELIEKDIVI
jgi:hypothetical protein